VPLYNPENHHRVHVFSSVVAVCCCFIAVPEAGTPPRSEPAALASDLAEKNTDRRCSVVAPPPLRHLHLVDKNTDVRRTEQTVGSVSSPSSSFVRGENPAFSSSISYKS
jgi:hypothetical protein